MSESSSSVRLAVDIGGTFTDIALDHAGRLHTAKVLTTASAPEQGVLAGIDKVLEQAALAPGAVDLLVHGTTLATNTVIERKGARTALVVTEGFRDSVEMGYEHRFEQYDVNIDKPSPLVPRHLRLPVRERVNAAGEVLIPLEAESLEALLPTLREAAVESVAVALIHGYANPAHEQRIAERLAEALPDLPVTLASDVCPEIREYERMSTASANAYVQPLMARYLQRLEDDLRRRGVACPLFLMTSGGGLTTIDTAIRHPIRLVESGPAGGAILACRLARECSLDQVLSYDMGGTTAKVCLIDEGRPQTSRSFEVDRQYRFTKGSGLPLRIPVIEMVEIGAGGGSIARIDALRRIQVGPDSAGSEPGPACYGRGGAHATVSDADLLLGRLSPDGFAGGAVTLSPAAAGEALVRDVGGALEMGAELAALAVSEVVDENMSNAARVHAVEQGKDVAARTLVAFGGAAPLHACRIADKLSIDRVIVPAGAGVGSAIGFLDAPVSYEIVRSRYARLDGFDVDALNSLLEEMQAEATRIVRAGVPEAPLEEVRLAAMRYVGQGHEITVPVPVRPLEARDAEHLEAAFNAAYEHHYGRTIPGMTIEILTWSLTVSGPERAAAALQETQTLAPPAPVAQRPVIDAVSAESEDLPVYRRADLTAGSCLEGPALVVEPQTTTLVGKAFTLTCNAAGHLDMRRRGASEESHP